MELGRLTAVDPRVVWPLEAHDFTPWLLEHADALADVLGIDLELTANEHPVGGFALDLIGRDVTDDCVLIVENQLTVTDHVHLGQLLTYAAGTGAATIVWIAVSFARSTGRRWTGSTPWRARARGSSASRSAPCESATRPLRRPS